MFLPLAFSEPLESQLFSRISQMGVWWYLILKLTWPGNNFYFGDHHFGGQGTMYLISATPPVESKCVVKRDSIELYQGILI